MKATYKGRIEGTLLMTDSCSESCCTAPITRHIHQTELCLSNETVSARWNPCIWQQRSMLEVLVHLSGINIMELLQLPLSDTSNLLEI